MLENLVLCFSWLVSEWYLVLVGVVLMLAGEALIEWAKPISQRKSIPLHYTRESRVREAVRAAEVDARWERLVKYSHWLEDGKGICKIHERSYDRMVSRAAYVDAYLHNSDPLEVRRMMLDLKERDREEYFAVLDAIA